MIFKNIYRGQRGNIFLLVIIFLLISTLLLGLIFKIDYTGIRLIKNQKEEKKFFKDFLNPSGKLSDNLVLYPKTPSALFDFNTLLKSGKICKDKNIYNYKKTFSTNNFCIEKSLENTAYLGAIIAKNNFWLNSDTLISSGDIYIPFSLTLTQENSYILSLSSIEIQNIIGEDNSKTYNLFIFSATNDIKIPTSTNIKIYDVPKTKFPTFNNQIFGLNFDF